MSTNFIVISGRKQVGKDTVGDYLSKLYSQKGTEVQFANHNELKQYYFKTSTKITSFAEPLKKFCSDVFGVPIEDMATDIGKQKTINLQWSDLHRPALIQDNYDFKSGNLTVRELLQYLGSNILRNRFYQDIWAQSPFIKDWSVKNVIITDCRFPNELKYARKYGAKIIRVIRDNVPQDNHISESALDNEDWSNDIVIYNNGTLDDLYRKIEDIFTKVIVC